MSRYDVVVLAGGYATRLRPLTYLRPKPLLPILDRPIIDWILDLVLKLPINRIFISTRYMADLIEDYVKKTRPELADRIVFVREDRPLGDAGPIRLIYERYGLTDTFIALYSDIFTNVDIEDALRLHKVKDGIATITLVDTDDVSRYGVVELDSEKRVTKFIEKPKGNPPSRLVNAGIYIFERDIVRYIPSLDKRSKLALDVLPKLALEGLLYGYVHMGYWFDIGTPLDYLKANFIALQRFCQGGCIGSEAPNDVEVISPAYIGHNVVIGHNSEVGPYVVIHDNVVLGDYVKVSHSIVMEKCHIGNASYVNNSIIAPGVYIGRWVRIEGHAIIGDEVYIEDYSYIAKNVVIGPHREVNESILNEGKVLP